MFAYLNQNADKRIFDALSKDGHKVIPLAPFSALDHPVSSHADMLLCAVDDTVFVHKDYPCEIKGFDNVIKVDEEISSKYPYDVLLNICTVGKNAFCNTKFASKTVLEHLKSNGYSIHHVSQGYAHCSTMTVSENAIITADTGIAKEAQKASLDVLVISSGYISLLPYEYGFIGGSCALCEDKIYICGSLRYHPEGERILKFCQERGRKVIELFDAPLTDIGGILFK